MHVEIFEANQKSKESFYSHKSQKTKSRHLLRALKKIFIGNKCSMNRPSNARTHLTSAHLVSRDPQHLQKQDRAYSPESCVYYCMLCDYSTKARLNLVQHGRSARHQQNEGLRKLQLHQQGLGGDEDGLSLHELFLVKECPFSQGLCYFNWPHCSLIFKFACVSQTFYFCLRFQWR